MYLPIRIFLITDITIKLSLLGLYAQSLEVLQSGRLSLPGAQQRVLLANTQRALVTIIDLVNQTLNN